MGEPRDDRAIEPLIAALSDTDWVVRQETANALGKLEAGRALEAPIVAISDDSLWEHAKRTLWQLLDHRAVGPLMVSLRDRNARVRSVAVEALTELGDAQAIEPLAVALRDSDVFVGMGAGAAQEIEDALAVEALAAALKDSHYILSSSAATALLRIGTPEALAAVQKYVEQQKQHENHQRFQRRSKGSV